MSLEESVERAMAENRDTQVARERLAELDGLKGEAMSGGLPQFTANGQFQRLHRRPEIVIDNQPFLVGTNNAYTGGATVSQLLFDGGKVIKAYKAAKSEEARGGENVKAVENEVRFQVRQTYYQIIYTDKVIEVLERQLAQLRAHLISIEARFKKGLESDYALMRQQVEVSNVEPDLIEMKRMRDLYENGIKVLLAIPMEDRFVPTSRFDYHAKVLPHPDTLVEKARDDRPDLKAEKFREVSLRQAVGVEKAGFWPEFKVSAQWQWQGQSNNWVPSGNERTDYLNTTVNLSWPVFDGLKTYSRVRQAKAKLIQQKYATTQLEDSAVKEVRNAYESLMRSREALAGQQKSLELAKRASGIAGERFEAGLTSQLELNDTITAQAKAEENYLKSSFDCLVAEAALEKAVGGEKNQ